VLESSDIVMGHASTVLFEAAYLKKKILIYEDKVSLKYMPSGLGYWFSDAEKLLELINQTERKDFQENYFWKGGDYCENFLAFYNNHILKQGEVKRL
jgi:CDP-glycerol glycerophosphotransferase (TagB/SpsB family)